jgi:hypothetical protein
MQEMEKETKKEKKKDLGAKSIVAPREFQGLGILGRGVSPRGTHTYTTYRRRPGQCER